jgi:ribonuclease HI
VDQLKLNTYHLIDVLDGLKTIKNESVDIIICDPPYGISGHNFGNNKDNLALKSLEEYIKWSKLWMEESIRILKNTGNMYIYGFSEILAHLSVNLNLNKKWLIWHYTNKTVPTYKSGWQRSHESIIWAYKNEPIFNVDDVRIPYTDTFLKNSAGKKRTQSDTARYGSNEGVYNAHPSGALPRDVYADGACIGNPGPAGVGVYLKFGSHEKRIGKFIGENLTNNIAELTAILTALEAIKSKELPINIYTDSQYAIGVLSKNFNAKANVELIGNIKRKLSEFPNLKFHWIRGHNGNSGNEIADFLANAAAKNMAYSDK